MRNAYRNIASHSHSMSGRVDMILDSELRKETTRINVMTAQILTECVQLYTIQASCLDELHRRLSG